MVKKVYIAHSFKNDRENNFCNVTAICRAVAGTRETVIPVSPLHMFSFLNDENPITM